MAELVRIGHGVAHNRLPDEISEAVVLYVLLKGVFHLLRVIRLPVLRFHRIEPDLADVMEKRDDGNRRHHGIAFLSLKLRVGVLHRVGVAYDDSQPYINIPGMLHQTARIVPVVLRRCGRIDVVHHAVSTVRLHPVQESLDAWTTSLNKG